MRRALIWPVIIIFSAVLAAIGATGILPVPVRFTLVGWFMFVIPGMAFVRLLHSLDVLQTWVLAVALSVVLSTALSMYMILARQWNPVNAMLALGLISICGAVLQLRGLRKTKLSAKLPND